MLHKTMSFKSQKMDYTREEGHKDGYEDGYDDGYSQALADNNIEDK